MLHGLLPDRTNAASLLCDTIYSVICNIGLLDSSGLSTMSEVAISSLTRASRTVK